MNEINISSSELDAKTVRSNVTHTALQTVTSVIYNTFYISSFHFECISCISEDHISGLPSKPATIQQ